MCYFSLCTSCLQKEEEELGVSIESHKRVAAETLRSLTVSLSGARTKQSSATETLESEVQVSASYCHAGCGVAFRPAVSYD